MEKSASATTTKLPWDVQNKLEDLGHEISHMENLNCLIGNAVEDMEDQWFKRDKEGIAIAYQLNRESMNTLLHLQMKLLGEVASTLERLRQYEADNDNDTAGKAEGWENRAIPSIDIDAMDRDRAHEQYIREESGQQK